MHGGERITTYDELIELVNRQPNVRVSRNSHLLYRFVFQEDNIGINVEYVNQTLSKEPPDEMLVRQQVTITEQNFGNYIIVGNDNGVTINNVSDGININASIFSRNISNSSTRN